MATVVPDTELKSARKKAKKMWRLLSNIFKAIVLLKTYETKVMYNVSDLIEEIKSSPIKPDLKRKPTLLSEKIDEHRLTTRLFMYIKSSNKEDLKKIKELIKNHPKRYTISQSNPDSFVNKIYHEIRPVYEAARLGYPETVKLLLKNGANPHLKCGKDMDESTLEVASRWRYQAVVALLLDHSNWESNELKKAMKDTNDQIYSMLQNKLSHSQRKNCVCEII
jgi:hypothetical protein